MKSLQHISFFLVLLFLTFSCTDDLVIEGPEIEWIATGHLISHSYTSGVVSGYRLYRSFQVKEGSGEIDIFVSLKGDDSNIFSETFQVEKGQIYRIVVKASRSGSIGVSAGESCLIVEFSSSNARESQQITIPNYMVSADGIDQYYCPEALIFKQIELD